MGSLGYNYRPTFLMLLENQKDDPNHTARLNLPFKVLITLSVVALPLGLD